MPPKQDGDREREERDEGGDRARGREDGQGGKSDSTTPHEELQQMQAAIADQASTSSAGTPAGGEGGPGQPPQLPTRGAALPRVALFETPDGRVFVEAVKSALGDGSNAFKELVLITEKVESGRLEMPYMEDRIKELLVGRADLVQMLNSLLPVDKRMRATPQMQQPVGARASTSTARGDTGQDEQAPRMPGDRLERFAPYQTAERREEARRTRRGRGEGQPSQQGGNQHAQQQQQQQPLEQQPLQRAGPAAPQPLPPGQVQQALGVLDAQRFVQDVKDAYQQQPLVYEEFLAILHDLDHGLLDRHAALALAAVLFVGQEALIGQFALIAMPGLLQQMGPRQDVPRFGFEARTNEDADRLNMLLWRRIGNQQVIQEFWDIVANDERRPNEEVRRRARRLLRGYPDLIAEFETFARLRDARPPRNNFPG